MTASNGVTREDVAREAGTSVAVVSYVVNNGPRGVAEATRQRVLDAIARTGYRPNAFARALAGGSTKTFGFIVPNISNPFIAEMAREVEARVFARDSVLLLGDSADDKDREVDLIRNFIQRRVDGLIYMGVDQDLALEHTAGTPVVCFTHGNSDGKVASVRIDERRAARVATDHLIDHGRSRLGVITGPETMMNSGLRLGGWRDALEQAGLPVIDELITYAPYTRRDGYEAGRRLLALRPDVDAILAGNQEQAHGLIAAATRTGRSIPDDLAIVALNGTLGSEYIVPALTVILQPFAAMAEKAMDVLAQPDAYPPVGITFDFDLIKRSSCGCDFEL